MNTSLGLVRRALALAVDEARAWVEPSMDCPACGATMRRLFMRHLRYVWEESRALPPPRARGRALPEGLYVECHACGDWSAFEPYVGVAIDVEPSGRRDGYAATFT